MKPEVDPIAPAISDYIDVLEGKKPAAEATVCGERQLTNEQRRRLPYIIALYRMPCYLCEAEPPCFYFLPFRAADAVTPWRLVSICKDCRKLEDVTAQIYAKLREELQGWETS